MILVSQPTIRVICPAGLVTGGTELLHQLVAELQSMGREAAIVYSPLGRRWTTPEAFARYACNVESAIQDDPDVAVVVPEVSTRDLYAYKSAKHVIWWLSVDNYSGSFERRDRFFHYLRRRLTSDIPNPRTAIHLFQSSYAQAFVRQRFRADGAMLTDYLADEYLAPCVSGRTRDDIVAYNPRKGIEFIWALMKRYPQFRFLALEGMSRLQLREALESCKAYVDFGPHPGKDRLPREAAMRGAVVVVGRRGSARFDKDVPLPVSYKIPLGRGSVDAAGSLIASIFADYPAHFDSQGGYRANIAAERGEFHRQVREVFGFGAA